MRAKATSTIALRERLATLLPPEAIAPASDMARYAVDGVVPQAVALPASVEQLSAALRLANDQGWVVAVRGSGALMEYGGVPKGVDLVLGLERMASAIDHAPGDLTVTVGAGVRLAALQEALGKAGQWLPVDPPLAGRQTMGGMLATNLSGPLSLAYGGLRDMVIGMRVAGPDGVVTKSGGKVVKNVTGFDVGKAHIGALGTLGVVLEASFKVAPLPKKDVTLVALFDSLAQAIKASHELLAHPSAPQALEVVLMGMNRRDDEGRMRQPTCNLYARLLGSEGAMERRLADCSRLLVQSRAVNVQPAGSQAAGQTWEWLADFGWDPQAGSGLLVRLGCLPSQVGELSQGIEEMMLRELHQGSLVVGPGRGVAKVFMPGLKWADADTAGTAVEALRGLAAGVQGYAVVERCPLPAKATLDVWGNPGDGLALMRRLKEQMDPRGVLNPGRYVGGI
ncbi:MAG: FAD-binding oxidoreductase [Chloroflexi bacterium]|nr:FAD-binding oxidoreductase [Chloroflexota bacterium]